MIRLARRIDFRWIRPACLDTNITDVDTDVTLTQTGWNPRHSVLKLKTIPLSECNKTYWDLSRNNVWDAYHDGISKSQYCAYDPRSHGTEHWYGAPLQILPTNSTPPYVIGLFLRGVVLGSSKEFPEVLTRIAYYIPWIEAHVWPFDRSTKFTSHCIAHN